MQGKTCSPCAHFSIWPAFGEMATCIRVVEAQEFGAQGSGPASPSPHPWGFIPSRHISPPVPTPRISRWAHPMGGEGREGVEIGASRLSVSLRNVFALSFQKPEKTGPRGSSDTTLWAHTTTSLLTGKDPPGIYWLPHSQDYHFREREVRGVIVGWQRRFPATMVPDVSECVWSLV